jgi:hypothetical protein
MFLAWRKHTEVQILLLAELPIARHIIVHYAETRTKTRWSVRWWFIRRVLTLPCMLKLSLSLHYVPKINTGYFLNSPCTSHVCLLLVQYHILVHLDLHGPGEVRWG